jgi:hypothetical protein
MSWPVVKAGLVEILEGVPGIKVMTTASPPAIDDWPFGYVLSSSGDVTYPANKQIRFVYHAVFRVVFPYSDPQAAEDSLAPFINSVPEYLISRVQLGGRLRNGNVDCRNYENTMTRVSGVEFLALDFHIYTADKYQYED